MTGVEFKATEDPGYYSGERLELVSQLPRPLGRVLDVGCGAGGVGLALRRAGATELTGVEIHPEMARRAEEVFDRVHVGDALELAVDGTLRGPYDTLVLYDVLEHLVDPALLLRRLHDVAAPGARVHVSVPNARHYSLVFDLVVRGTFGYREWGHRDATHLRWFTRRDMEDLLGRTGWTLASSSPALLGRTEAASRLTLGLLREFLALQWHFLGTR